jgi:hypothetical protein
MNFNLKIIFEFILIWQEIKTILDFSFSIILSSSKKNSPYQHLTGA